MVSSHAPRAPAAALTSRPSSSTASTRQPSPSRGSSAAASRSTRPPNDSSASSGRSTSLMNSSAPRRSVSRAVNPPATLPPLQGAARGARRHIAVVGARTQRGAEAPVALGVGPDGLHALPRLPALELALHRHVRAVAAPHLPPQPVAGTVQRERRREVPERGLGLAARVLEPRLPA